MMLAKDSAVRCSTRSPWIAELRRFRAHNTTNASQSRGGGATREAMAMKASAANATRPTYSRTAFEESSGRGLGHDARIAGYVAIRTKLAQPSILGWRAVTPLRLVGDLLVIHAGNGSCLPP